MTKLKNNMKTVMVFGVFDMFHKGHEAFLKQANALGDTLIVCLAQDDVVKELKGAAPQQSLIERMRVLKTSRFVDDVIPGDTNIGVYNCLKDVHPDIIALGYDQDALRNDLEAWLVKNESDIEHRVMRPFEPDIYKSSKIRSTTLYD